MDLLECEGNDHFEQIVHSFGQVLDGRNWSKQVLPSFFHFGRKKQVLDGKNPTLSLDLALPRVSSIELALYISSSIYPYICYFYIYLVLSSICIYFSILPSGSHSLDSFIYLYPSLDISFCQSTFLALSIDISLSLSLTLYRSHSLDHSLKLCKSLSISLYLVLYLSS